MLYHNVSRFYIHVNNSFLMKIIQSIHHRIKAFADSLDRIFPIPQMSINMLVQCYSLHQSAHNKYRAIIWI